MKKKLAKRKPVKQRNGQAARQGAFLAAYRLTASITKAAAAARIDRKQHYEWMERPAYAETFRAAQVIAAQVLEDEAVRRAHEGIDEPLVYQGEFTYPEEPKRVDEGNLVLDSNLRPVMQRVEGAPPLAIRKYSDALLMFLLKAHDPTRFRERGTVEVTGKDGGPMESTLTVKFVKPGEK